MIKSMTGFGRSVQEIDGYVITVELRSVNHRYFDFSARVPRQYGFLEEKIKSYVNTAIARGKVDCLITVEALNTESSDVVVNHTLASAYLNALNEIAETYGLKTDFGATTLSRFPEVLVVRKAEEDEEKLWSYVKTVADDAVKKLVAMRAVEGEKMKADISARCDSILQCVSFIEARSPQTVKEYNDKLVARVHELIGDITVDEARLLQETAIFADKVAVAEETVRLRSHIDQMHAFLESEEPIGRKMDFLVQEFNREANTIGSKANDVEIAAKVLDIKAEVEKIREQIQNIE